MPSFKIGQRETTAFIFVIVTLVALLAGKTPENVYLDLVGPLIAIAATFLATIRAINARVSDGTLTPGSFTELVKNREFISGLILLGLSVLPMVGITVSEAQKEQYLEIGVNFITVVLGPILMISFGARGSTKPSVEPTT